MDETSFRIGYRKAQLVITMDQNKPLRMINPDNCDYITSVECIGLASRTFLPMLLVFRVYILHKWCHYNDLDGGNVISITKFGYANNDIALEWL